MKPIHGLFWVVFLMSMSSCVSYEKFSIEVYKPAELTVPAEMKKVVLVSRNLKYLNDTLQNYHVADSRLLKDKKVFNVDSLAITNCLDTLAGRLSKQNRFEHIGILPVGTLPRTREKEIRPAIPTWYKRVAEKTGADGLILLDMFSCFYRQNSSPSPSAWVITSNIWSVYDAKAQKLIDRHSQVDTLLWDGTDEDGQGKKFRIPGKKDAIALASGVIGANYSKHIIPAWAKVERQIMTDNNPDLKTAADLAKKNNWADASAIWNKYTGKGNKTLKVIALYNLALASEMNGDIDKALEMISLAAKESSGTFKSAQNDAVRRYAIVLYRRQNDLNKLKLQNGPQ